MVVAHSIVQIKLNSRKETVAMKNVRVMSGQTSEALSGLIRNPEHLNRLSEDTLQDLVCNPRETLRTMDLWRTMKRIVTVPAFKTVEDFVNEVLNWTVIQIPAPLSLEGITLAEKPTTGILCVGTTSQIYSLSNVGMVSPGDINDAIIKMRVWQINGQLVPIEILSLLKEEEFILNVPMGKGAVLAMKPILRGERSEIIRVTNPFGKGVLKIDFIDYYKDLPESTPVIYMLA